MPTETQNAPEAPQVSTELSGETKVYGIFTGNFAPDMKRLFENSRDYLGLTPEKADKLAQNWASEAGRILSAAKQKVDYSKLKKDGKIDIKLAAKVANVTLTYAICIDMLLRAWLDLASLGLHLQKAELVVQDNIAKYIADL